jgi:hypothetical protein
VKIPSLLAQYLYCHQRLDLPGIGSFVLDSSSVAALENSKQRLAVLEGVSFNFNPGLQETPDLVAFIAEKTGKMKPLAAADLDSHLQLAHQFLNIGKPFTFEGIGILSKIKAGEFELTPISVSTEKIKEFNIKETESTPAKDQANGKYESFLSPEKTKLEWKRPMAAFFIICGVGITIWGGYTISTKAKKNKSVAMTESSNPETIPPVDSNRFSVDTAAIAKQMTLPVETNYKYVLEIAKGKRAFKRYNQLKDINWAVQLETQDSIQFKLFMLLPVSDTSKTLDSLTVMTGRKVYIEYPGQSDAGKANL